MLQVLQKLIFWEKFIKELIYKGLASQKNWLQFLRDQRRKETSCEWAGTGKRTMQQVTAAVVKKCQEPHDSEDSRNNPG